MASLETWKSIEDASWDSLPCLGSEWLLKSSASDVGYSLMVTDGCTLWGEKRTANYIEDKAEDWSSCIEAGIRELSELVLSELRKPGVKVVWGPRRQTLSFSFSSKLNDLSYIWKFHLDLLSDDLFRHHWMQPLLVHIQHLASKVTQLNTELDRKRQQLEELLPDKKTTNKVKATKREDGALVAAAVKAVMTGGTWKVLKDHMGIYPQIMSGLTSAKNAETNNDGGNTNPSNKIAESGNKSPNADFDRANQEEEARKEMERRAHIQELTQGTAMPHNTPKKKKKKLNI